MKTIALITTLILASCAEYPIAIGIQNEHGTASYSSKGGLVINVQK